MSDIGYVQAPVQIYGNTLVSTAWAMINSNLANIVTQVNAPLNVIRRSFGEGSYFSSDVYFPISALEGSLIFVPTNRYTTNTGVSYKRVSGAWVAQSGGYVSPDGKGNIFSRFVSSDSGTPGDLTEAYSTPHHIRNLYSQIKKLRGTNSYNYYNAANDITLASLYSGYHGLGTGLFDLSTSLNNHIDEGGHAWVNITGRPSGDVDKFVVGASSGFSKVKGNLLYYDEGWKTLSIGSSGTFLMSSGTTFSWVKNCGQLLRDKPLGLYSQISFMGFPFSIGDILLFEFSLSSNKQDVVLLPFIVQSVSGGSYKLCFSGSVVDIALYTFFVSITESTDPFNAVTYVSFTNKRGVAFLSSGLSFFTTFDLYVGRIWRLYKG